ncbi:hypothetical protein V9L05_18800 [Bernardetia sp. Wsw4-3y2]|uniref:hypothetical protein n=1 Tax=Bernardetia sp. Wsw4-3y2 TaxID=3127471 RepID=UPI0030CDD78B
MDKISIKLKKRIEEYHKHCAWLREVTKEDLLVETPEEKEARIQRLLDPQNYAEFFQYYFSHYAEFPCAWYHVKAANDVVKNEVIDQVNIWYREAAKSTEFVVALPVLLMNIHRLPEAKKKKLGLTSERQIDFMVVVGINEVAGRTLLSDLQAELEYNQKIIEDFGKQVVSGDWAEGEFRATNGTLFRGIGIKQPAQGMRNRQYRPDYVVIDDIDERDTAENPVIVKKMLHRVMGTIKAGMKQERARLIVNNNLFHRAGITAKIIEALKGKPATNIFQVDITNKKGEPNWKERFTIEKVKKLLERFTESEVQRQYYNNPVEVGKEFKAEWMQHKKMLPLHEYECLIAYGDLAYEDAGCTKNISCLGYDKFTGEFHHIWNGLREELGEVIACYYQFDKQYIQGKGAYPILWIEGNASQKAHYKLFFNTKELLKTYRFINVNWDLRQKGNKWNRIASIAPLFKNSQFYFNEALKDNLDQKTLISQFLTFEKNTTASVDGPDSVHGAINIIQEIIAVDASELKNTSVIKKRSIKGF